jgi:hypothetical protein
MAQQFQLPQFIETEDKIVGPLTIKQFIFMSGAFGAAAVLYFVLNTFIWLLIALPLCALGVAFAFVHVNGQPFAKVLASAFKYYWSPQMYIWQNEPMRLKYDKAAAPAEDAASTDQSNMSLEKVVAGMALKTAWQEVQTGSQSAPAIEAKKSFAQLRDRYEVFKKMSGERHAAKRVDYR